jgi:RNA polymerase sigma-70 factor (ECF subfamily)
VDERELLTRCLSGDQAAWRDLVARYDPVLSQLARIILRSLRRQGSEWEIDEVKAGVLEMLVVHDCRVLRYFRWQCSLETWLRVLVRTVAIRMIRRKTVDPADLARPDAGEQPIDRLLTGETQAAVRKALDALPARDRLVLTMFFIDGRSYQEIASLAKIPMGTIATVISRSRLKLRDLLKSSGVVEDPST